MHISHCITVHSAHCIIVQCFIYWDAAEEAEVGLEQIELEWNRTKVFSPSLCHCPLHCLFSTVHWIVFYPLCSAVPFLHCIVLCNSFRDYSSFAPCQPLALIKLPRADSNIPRWPFHLIQTLSKYLRLARPKSDQFLITQGLHKAPVNWEHLEISKHQRSNCLRSQNTGQSSFKGVWK